MANEIQFYEGRRELEFGDFVSLKTTGNERRVKINMRIPISNHSMVGIPSWVSQGHEVVVRDKSFYTKAICKGVRMEGMSIDFFSTDTVKRKLRTLNGATMDKFSVERVGKDDKCQTFLNMVVYAPCSLEIIQWCYETQGATVFAEFDTTQAEFSYKGDEEESEDGEVANGFDFESEAEAPEDPAADDPRNAPPKRSHHKKKS